MKEIEQLSINTIRILASDMVENAKSGHPGMPLGAAPMAFTLFAKFLKHNPENPKWFDRDRFILSAGHGCALLYSLLHLCGYGLTIEDLKSFRKFKSKTPGHPEYGVTPGVEATTGPLGQGFAMGVGMAIAEKALSDCFNKENFKIIDHYTYAIVSDGDLMEGITSEAASLAGTLKLGKLIYLYDDNDITIEGNKTLAFTENVRERFDAYGWHTQYVVDGNDTDAIYNAIENAKKEKNKPSLIIIRTHIGYGSPKQDTASVHGEPLGEEALKKTKEFFKFPVDKFFYIPEEVYKYFNNLKAKWKKENEEWNKLFMSYKEQYPSEADLLEKYINGNINKELLNNLKFFEKDEVKKIATRFASGKTMNLIEKYFTEFMGGSADLAPSTKTYLEGFGSLGISKSCARNIHYGVREHAMGAITNGIALHGGIIPYCATFLAFSDYMRPAIRLSAIMQTHSIFVFTHDSIAVGEDGPTHQPVEQLSSLRMIPGLTVIRPADANETVAAWYLAITNKRPVCIILTRQEVPVLDYKKYKIFEGVLRGAYILETDDNPDIIIIATGSEVHLALSVYPILKEKGIKSRIISMPSYEIFNLQDNEYKNFILPDNIRKRLIIECGSPYFWYHLAKDGEVFGVNKFGASGNYKDVYENYGFTTENILNKIYEILKR
ncbi:MAG: transketolase [Candidatus Goldbacteria bacterium]|nr:transketolase [Candidatus Goldiibacteriota bacterium]